MSAPSPEEVEAVRRGTQHVSKLRRTTWSSADGHEPDCDRALAEILLAIYHALARLTGAAPCPLTPLPAPGVDMTKPE